VSLVVTGYVASVRIGSGDPTGFDLMHEALGRSAVQGLNPSAFITVLACAYQEAEIALFHKQADALHDQLRDAMDRHQIGWMSLIEPYRALGLVARGRYDAARRIWTAGTFDPGSIDHAVITTAAALFEVRAGSLDRARELLSSVPQATARRPAALCELAWLELAGTGSDPDLGETAQRVYGTMNRRHHARIAGVAAVALAYSGRGAPPPPPWLAPSSPLRVFWDWAAGIDRVDTVMLGEVSTRLITVECTYEAALALRDAGDHSDAYRALRELGATTVRTQLAERLRLRGQHIPRRSRSADDPHRLTETEREVCRHLATGASNPDVAAQLGVSVRTVETHLTHIYEKTGCRGRAALATWWTRQRAG
jgi:DNA-binding CsgD family transcriptional regulator